FLFGLGHVIACTLFNSSLSISTVSNTFLPRIRKNDKNLSFFFPKEAPGLEIHFTNGDQITFGLA
ncbi:hypothetical protein PJI17_33045, partial [Mycobacterium kansasii]